MKKITLSLLALFSTIIIIAQSPQAFKYQTVVRDNTGTVITNQSIGFRISILDDNAAGSVLYQETHLVNTNDYGLANLEIGNGTPVSGLMSDINWGTNDKFLQIEMDETGGTNYQLMGTSQLLSVPYSLHSATTSDTTRWQKNMDDLYYLKGNVGIGTDIPQIGYNLDIQSITEGQSRLRLSTLDYSKSLFFTSGSNTFDQSIVFEGGDALRFMKYEQGGGYNELMRIQEDGDVGIGTNAPEETAILELNSNSKGLLTPRMTEADRNAIVSPAEGLLIYQTDASEGFYFFKSGVWTKLSQTTKSTAQVATPVLTICCQSWMTTNLDVDKYRNGDPIPHVIDPTEWAALTTGAYCYYNNDSATYAAVYGKLYNWYAVNDPRGLAPEGWHIPTHFEWTTLTDCLGGESVAGGALKEAGFLHWGNPNTGATNYSGFSALPGGYCNSNGFFQTNGLLGVWWSVTENSSENAFYRLLYYNEVIVLENDNNKHNGFSVRCLRD